MALLRSLSNCCVCGSELCLWVLLLPWSSTAQNFWFTSERQVPSVDFEIFSTLHSCLIKSVGTVLNIFNSKAILGCEYVSNFCVQNTDMQVCIYMSLYIYVHISSNYFCSPFKTRLLMPFSCCKSRRSYQAAHPLVFVENVHYCSCSGWVILFHTQGAVQLLLWLLSPRAGLGLWWHLSLQALPCVTIPAPRNALTVCVCVSAQACTCALCAPACSTTLIH